MAAPADGGDQQGGGEGGKGAEGAQDASDSVCKMCGQEGHSECPLEPTVGSIYHNWEIQGVTAAAALGDAWQSLDAALTHWSQNHCCFRNGRSDRSRNRDCFGCKTDGHAETCCMRRGRAQRRLLQMLIR